MLADKFAARPLFGNLSQTDTPAVASVGQDMHLLGVLSSNRTGGARAIVRQDGNDKTWVLGIGEELLSGVKITRIEPKQITVSNMGREITLSLPKPPAHQLNTSKK